LRWPMSAIISVSFFLMVRSSVFAVFVGFISVFYCGSEGYKFSIFLNFENLYLFKFHEY
jgi:hypothetical protein